MRAWNILLILSLLFISTQVFANETTQKLLNESFGPTGYNLPELRPQLDQASAEFQRLPDPLKIIFGTQNTEINLKLDDGSTVQLGAQTRNGRITWLTKGVDIHPTLRVWIDEQTAYSLAASKDVTKAFIVAVNQGKIRYEGIGAESLLVVYFANFAVFVSNLVSGIAQALGIH